MLERMRLLAFNHLKHVVLFSVTGVLVSYVLLSYQGIFLLGMLCAAALIVTCRRLR